VTVSSVGSAWNPILIPRPGGGWASYETSRIASGASIESSTDVAAGSATVTDAILFSDDFSSGDFSKTENGFSWDGATHCEVISGFSRHGNTGNCVRFDMDAGGAGGVAELRFLIGSTQPQVWRRFYIFFPLGTESPYRGPKALNSSNNNKFGRIYALPENNYPRYGESFYAGAAGGDFNIGPQAGIFPGTGTVSQVGSGYSQDFTDAMRGRWVKIEFMTKGSTSAGTPNGEHQCWIDNVEQWHVTGLNSYEASGRGFNGGYILGAVDTLWQHAGTYVYVDDFALSIAGRA